MSELECWVDLRRPTITCDESRDFWRRIHDVVDSFGSKITVNDVYALMKEYIETEHVYAGSSFSYKFWFDTVENRTLFLEKLTEIVGVATVKQLEIS